MRQYVLLACLSPVACLMAATGQKGGNGILPLCVPGA